MDIDAKKARIKRKLCPRRRAGGTAIKTPVGTSTTRKRFAAKTKRRGKDLIILGINLSRLFKRRPAAENADPVDVVVEVMPKDSSQ